ncbi:hypothetical protein PHMEG_0009475 [Phytophthora megakarya]|uniref:RNase H type-1 domain-containing protein n=1 Tax=Phytophthora megakarya TaxID=4795 RepID=A0A225WHW0_9STRA|nr:hypothetical protein PHMEG_0009475 [Phytophthora megakarya]
MKLDPKVVTRRFTNFLAISFWCALRALTTVSSHRISGSPEHQAYQVVSEVLFTTEPAIATLAVSTRVEHNIFFDGGSWGNPGPGGIGTVILQTTAIMSYRRASMTNNEAEYLGLFHGFGYAWAARLQSVHVVGDRQLIIRQMRDRRTSKAEVLRTLYRRCQLLADECRVETWIHHYREFNRMADSLSNLAMDTTHSRQTRLPVHGEPNGCWSASF